MDMYGPSPKRQYAELEAPSADLTASTARGSWVSFPLALKIGIDEREPFSTAAYMTTVGSGVQDLPSSSHFSSSVPGPESSPRDDGVGTIFVFLVDTFEFPNNNSCDGWLMALLPPEDVSCVSGVEVTTTWAPGVVTEGEERRCRPALT